MSRCKQSKSCSRQVQKNCCNKNEENCDDKISLRVTADIQTPFPEGLYDTSSITGDGRFVFIARTPDTTNPIPADQVAATIYSNNNGNLTQLKTAPTIANFIVDGGAISTNGDIAYIVEEDPNGGGQARVFNVPSLTLRTIIQLPGYDGTTGTLVGSSTILNGKYIIANGIGSDQVTGTVYLINIISGTVVATGQIQGRSNIGGIPFELNGDIYVAIDSTGDINSNGPFSFIIFKLSGRNLIRVTEFTIPTGTLGYNVLVRSENALIAVTTGRTNTPGVPLVAGQTPTGIAYTGEPGGLAIYKFNGDDICLTGFKTVNLGTYSFRAVAFHPCGKFVSAIIRPRFTYDSGILVTYRLVKGKNCENNLLNQVSDCCHQYILDCQDIAITTPNTINLQYSENGKWVVASGGTFGISPVANFSETALYKVANDVCPKC